MAGVDTVKMAQRVLEHQGVTFEQKKNKHVKFVVAHDGKKTTIVTGGTCSDRRAIMNFYHDIRRALTGIGFPFVECKSLVYN